MMDMAVGVIIGSAFSGIVTSLTDNFINPILNLVTGGQTYTLQDEQALLLHFFHRWSISLSWHLYCSVC